MRTLKMRQWLTLIGWLLVALTSQADYINHTFDAVPFTNGATFVTQVQQWQATTSGVRVVDTKSFSPSNSVYLPVATEISNLVSVTTPSVVWTDFRTAPFLGEAPETSITTGVALVQYFGTNGYLTVWTNGGWLVCSNDVWGQPVIPATNGVFADVSIYQNFSNHTAAILINDQVVCQDLPFPGTFVNYGSFKASVADGDSWLDDVFIQPTNDPVRLTHDRNGEGTLDGNELQAYGYVARTQYVGSGPGIPGHATIQAALNEWRARDWLYVYSGQYAENITVSTNMTFGGQSFTNSGSLTIGSGVNVTFQGSTVWSNVTIGANAQVLFSQALTCSNLFVLGNAAVTFGGVLSVGGMSVAQGASVALHQSTACGALANTGTVTLADGRMLTLNSATMSGVLLATGASTVTVATVLSVPASGTGHLDFSGGRLLVTSAGVDMTGTFSITNTWGTQATMPLDFTDNFELYAPDTIMTNLGFRGWGATSSGVVVRATQGLSSSKGAVLSGGSVLSNRVTSGGQLKIWTDFYTRPTRGESPDVGNTNQYAFFSFVDTSGFLNVWKTGVWVVCSNVLDGSGGTVTAMDTGAYARVTLFMNYDSHLAAVFVDGKLVCQQVPFPAGATISGYTSFRAESPDSSLALDNVGITIGIPSGLSRAEEIQINDALMPLGSVFKIR